LKTFVYAEQIATTARPAKLGRPLDSRPWGNGRRLPDASLRGATATKQSRAACIKRWIASLRSQ
jgi:hypothetical protein